MSRVRIRRSPKVSSRSSASGTSHGLPATPIPPTPKSRTTQRRLRTARKSCPSCAEAPPDHEREREMMRDQAVFESTSRVTQPQFWGTLPARWDSDTDDTLVCCQVRQETHDVK